MTSNSSSPLSFADKLKMFGPTTRTAQARVEAAKSSGLPPFASKYLINVAKKMNANNAKRKANNATRTKNANATRKRNANANATRKRNANANAKINKMSSTDLTNELVTSMDRRREEEGERTEAEENFFLKLQKKREETMDELSEEESHNIMTAYFIKAGERGDNFTEAEKKFFQKLKEWRDKQEPIWREQREERERESKEMLRKEKEKEEDEQIQEFKTQIENSGGMQDLSNYDKWKLRLLLRNRASRSEEMWKQRDKYLRGLDEARALDAFDREEIKAQREVYYDKEEKLTPQQIWDKHKFNGRNITINSKS